MAEASLKLGGSWATKEGSLLGFNDENGNYKPIPFDFTRATTATRVNRDGLIEEVQSGVPRIDFTDSAGSLLLEPQRTNLITYSEDFSEWSNLNNAVVTDNFIASPDGTQNAAKIVYDGTTSGRIEISTTASGTNTQSVYLKTASGTQNVSIGASSGNLTEVTVTSDWQRFTHTGSGSFPRILCDDAATIYVWGAQLEAGSYATSYIPTSGSAVTRNADATNKTDISSLIGQTEGTMFIEFNATEDAPQNMNLINFNNSTQASVLIAKRTSGALRAQVFAGGSAVVDINSAIVSGTTKAAFAYKSGDTVLYVNGVAISNSNTFTFNGTLSELIFPSHQAYFNYGHKYSVNQAMLYKTRLTDTELQELTTL